MRDGARSYLVDFIETQIEPIEQIGIQNYIRLQSDPAKGPD